MAEDQQRRLDEALRLHRQGALDGAIRLYRALLEDDPESADTWHLMGVAAHQKGESALARRLIETAIDLDGTSPDYHSNLAMVLVALGETAAAEAALQYALSLAPDHARAMSNLAGVLRGRGAFAEACAMAERAVAANPEDAEAHNNLGNALKDMGRVDAAVASYRAAIARDPDFALAHWNLALALLTRGDYAEGFQEMAWRWQWSGFPARRRDYRMPAWRGEPIEGETVFLYPEQGLGDAIQFVRYAPMVRALGARVIVEGPGGLAPLIAAAGLADAVARPAETPPRFDRHAPFLDLPRLFATTLDTVPAQVPYLVADAALADSLRARTHGRGGLRVGLNWTGNPASPVERFRGLPADALAPLAGLDGIDWISLQKGPGGDALPRPAGRDLIETGEAPLAETAALITTLDLVVTSDTAVAHLAGALAVPTLVLLHHAPDWRWHLGRDDSPWYPTLSLIRQPAPGDWADVVARVSERIAAQSTGKIVP